LGLQRFARLGCGPLSSPSMNVQEATHQTLTDDTVDRSPVDHVFVPYDRVDALYQTTETSPCHVRASCHVPSYGVDS
jgi:hypothetical protein